MTPSRKLLDARARLIVELQGIIDENQKMARETRALVQRYKERDDAELSRPEARGRIYMDE